MAIRSAPRGQLLMERKMKDAGHAGTRQYVRRQLENGASLIEIANSLYEITGVRRSDKSLYAWITRWNMEEANDAHAAR